MKVYETSATVEPDGDVHVGGVAFSPGTEVESTIAPKRAAPEEFAAAWERLTRAMRASPSASQIGDEDIQQEIDSHRLRR